MNVMSTHLISIRTALLFCSFYLNHNRWLISLFIHAPMRYQSSSSSSFLPDTACCLARNASASPPAKLPPPILFGVALPLSVPLPVLRDTPLSLDGAGGGSGFRPPAAGRLLGGAGGVGFAFAGLGARALLPLTVREGVGTARGGAAGGGGGGGARTSATASSST